MVNINGTQINAGSAKTWRDTIKVEIGLPKGSFGGGGANMASAEWNRWYV